MNGLPGLATLVLVVILTAQPVAGQQADATISETGRLRVSYLSELTPIGINTMHSWRLHVEEVAGGVVEEAEISVSGGMSEHDHGLLEQVMFSHVAKQTSKLVIDLLDQPHVNRDHGFTDIVTRIAFTIFLFPEGLVNRVRVFSFFV